MSRARRPSLLEGRPPFATVGRMGSQGRGRPIDELRPLADWFAGALEHEGYDGVAHFIASDDYFGTKRAKIYRLAAAEGTIDKPLMRLIALTLNDADTGLWLWEKAWEALQVSAAKEARESERVDFWTLIPHILDPDVERLLQAQRQEVRLLPYRELAVNAPALTTIYVRQRVQARMESGEPEAEREKRRRFRDHRRKPEAIDDSSAFDALNRHAHLVLTGEAGSGKTTFSYYTTELLSRIWLGDLSPRDCAVQTPMMPLRVLARHLTGGKPWDEELAEAVRKTLGSRLLSRFSPELLKGRVHGVRWLVFVDGLDEITDAEARRELIGTLAHHARVSEQYRFVIGTRMLESSELAPLRGESVGAYEMVPFRREDLETFAANWFSAQDLSHTDDHWRAHADRYLHQVHDSRLRELVRNPLLATIAAVVSTRDPGKPLPTNRLDLYRTVVRYLIDDAYSGRRSEARGDLDVWLHEQRERLIEHLGRARIKGDPLLASAADWIAENWTGPGDREVHERAARRQLTATGLFVQEDRDVRFLHHSFAEYLSGLGFAAAIGPDAGALATWVAENQGRDENLLLFAILSWHRLHGGDLRPLLLEDEPQGHWHRLSVRLIGDGLDLGDEVTAAVVARAVRYALVYDDSGFDVLGRMYGNPITAAHLRRLIDHGELSADVRARALLALGRVTDFNAVGDALMELVPAASLQTRLLIARSVAEDLPGGEVAEAVDILARCVETALAEGESMTAMTALGRLCDLGAGAVADRLLDAVLANLPSPTSQAHDLAMIVARVRGRAGLEQMVSQDYDPWGRAYLATGLAEAGHDDLAARVVRETWSHPGADGFDLRRVCEAWITINGDPETMRRAIAARTDLGQNERLDVAERLAQSGAAEEAIAIASGVLNGPDTSPGAVADAAELWASAKSREETEKLLGELGARYENNPVMLAALARAAKNAEHDLIALDLARRAAVSADPVAAVEAFDVLIEVASPEEVRSPASARWEALPDTGRLRLAMALRGIDRDLALTIARSVSPWRVRRSDLTETLAHLGVPLSEMPVEVRHPIALGTDRSNLAESRPGDYLAVLPDALADPGTQTKDVLTAIRQYLDWDMRDSAIETLRTFLTTPDPTPETRARASAMLAFLSFARPGTKTCGVPGCPGDPAIPTSQES